jgi:low affinity Fe/Cu permease
MPHSKPAPLIGQRPSTQHEQHPAHERGAPTNEPFGAPTASPESAPSKERFRCFAHRVSYLVGTPGAFLIALLVLVVWTASGPVFHFSDTWQLIINTGTTIVTFLMVFLIQTTQNRDASAMHLKLDELIRATRSARNDLVGLEQMSDSELKALEEQFEELRNRARAIRTTHSDVRTDS